MIKLLLWTSGILLSLIILILLLMLTVDMGLFKKPLSAFASTYLDREVRIEGDLSIRIGSSFAVSASDVRLSSTDWTEVPDLLTVRKFDLSADTRSLLSDQIEIHSVRIEGLRLHLTEGSDGRNNFTLPETGSADESSSLPGVILTRAELTDGRVSYQSPGLAQPMSLAVDSLVLEANAEQYISIALAASLNETPVSATGSVGQMDNLIATTDVTFDLSAAIGEIALIGSGRIDDLTRPRQPGIELQVHGPGAEYLTDILGMRPVTSGPMDLAITLAPDPEGLRAEVDGAFGEFSISLRSRLTDLQNLDSVTLSADAAGPSLETLGRLAGQNGFPEKPFTVDVEAEKNGNLVSIDHLIFRTGDAKLNASARFPDFPSIAGGIAEMKIEGPRFEEFNWLPGLPGRFTGPFSVTGSLKQTDDVGQLRAELTSEALQVELSARISAEQDLTGSQINITSGDDDFRAMAAALEIQSAPALPFSSIITAEIGRQAITLSNSSLTLGSDQVTFSGVVGREPLSDLTRIEASSSLEDLKKTLTPFGVELPQLPFNALEVALNYSHDQDFSLLNASLHLPVDTQVVVDARIGDSMDLQTGRVRTTIRGTDLEALLPAELKRELAGPFSAAADFRLAADQILMENGRAEFRDAQVSVSLTTPRDTPFAAGTTEFRFSSPGILNLAPEAGEFIQQDQPLQVLGSSAWTEAEVRLDSISVQSDRVALKLNGTLALAAAHASAKHELQFETDIESLRALQFLTPRPLPDEPFRLLGTVAGDSSTITVSFDEFVLGQSSIVGRMILRPEGTDRPRPSLDLYARSALLDLRPLAPLFEEDNPAPGPASADGRVIPDNPLPLEQLRMVDVQIDLLADRVLTPELDLSDVTLTGVILEGALDIDQFSLAGDMGTLNGALEATPSPLGLDLKLAITGADLTIGLPAENDADLQRLPKYALDILLNSSGTTTRELAAGATGYLKGVSDSGEVNLAALGLFTRDFAGEVLNTVNPFAKKEPLSKIQCTGLLVELEDGILFGDPILVFQTDRLNIAAVARVDLATEKLNATFSTRARTGIGISVGDIFSPYTEIGGTLAAPRLQLNSKSAILAGSTTIATGGLSFLAKKAHERFLADRNPCQSEIQKAEEILKVREFAVPPT